MGPENMVEPTEPSVEEKEANQRLKEAIMGSRALDSALGAGVENLRRELNAELFIDPDKADGEIRNALGQLREEGKIRPKPGLPQGASYYERVRQE